MPNLNLYRTEYEKVVGKTYGTLSIREKQTVYAMEIYEDSKDALTAFDIYSQDFPKDFIEDQCRNTFGYKDASIIPPVIFNSLGRCNLNRSGKCVCTTEPRGDYSLEGFWLDEEYFYIPVKKDMRVYPSQDFPQEYITCSKIVFKKYFKIKV